MIRSLVFNPYVIGGLVVLLIASHTTAYLKGYSKGSKIELTKCQNEKSGVINENIETRIRQDNIKRLDNDALIDSLRDNTF